MISHLPCKIPTTLFAQMEIVHGKSFNEKKLIFFEAPYISIDVSVSLQLTYLKMISLQFLLEKLNKIS